MLVSEAGADVNFALGELEVACPVVVLAKTVELVHRHLSCHFLVFTVNEELGPLLKG